MLNIFVTLIMVRIPFSCAYLTTALSIMQGVGPSIAISFSVYETLRASWQSHRWLLYQLIQQFWGLNVLQLPLHGSCVLA